jgi:hypothetical protein
MCAAHWFLAQLFSALKMYVTHSSEKLAHILITRHYIKEDDNINNYRYENLKSYMILHVSIPRRIAAVSMTKGFQIPYN